MRLRWYDRILFALSGLVLVALGVGVVLVAGNVIQLPEAVALDTWLGTGWQWLPLLFLVGIVLIIWGLFLLVRPFRSGEKAGGKYYVLKDASDGDVKISLHAIDHLVHKVLDAYAQVTASKVKIGGKEDAMEITLHLTVRSDVSIPSLVDEVKEDIKRSLQHSAGVTVSSVKVFVDATKDDKGAAEMKYIEAKSAAQQEAPVEDFINTPSFYTAPVVITGDADKPEAPAPVEPTVAELKKEIDLGPKEPLPVDLSAQAFPFPEAEAGVPLEIYTADVPIKDTEEDADAD